MKLTPTKIISLFIAALLGISTVFAFASPTYAATDVCSVDAPDEVKAAASCPGYETNNDITDVIVNILNVVIGVTSLVAVIFIVIGGVNYITSAGDASKIQKARHTIIYACIGLAICALAFAIVNFAVRYINESVSSTTENSIAFLEKKL